VSAQADLFGLERILAEEQRLVLIDFWSPWCAPCRTLRPHLERLADQSADKLRLVEVNVEKAPDAAERFAVQGVPTILLIRENQILHRFQGAVMPLDIAAKVEALTR
jgi:thioredoxin